MFIAQVSY